jgi:Tol biopolymer transport system component
MSAAAAIAFATSRGGVEGIDERIAFVVRPVGKYGDVDASKPGQLYSVKADGKGLTLIAKNISDPAASPDGARIAYMRRNDVWVMDASGRHQRRLRRSTRWTVSPAWSADGESLFFLRADGIYHMRADGTKVRPRARGGVSRRSRSFPERP